MHTGVYFELNGVIYPNNSATPLSHIGTDTSALHCHTNLEGCCGTPRMTHERFTIPMALLFRLKERNMACIATEVISTYCVSTKGFQPAIQTPLQESIDVRSRMSGEIWEISIISLWNESDAINFVLAISCS